MWSAKTGQKTAGFEDGPPADDTADGLPPKTESLSRFSSLFQAHGAEIRAFLTRKLGNRDDASDATQEVFLKFWRQERQGRLDGPARGYLFTIAFNMARDCRRRARARVADKHEPLVSDAIEDERQSAEETVEWRQGLSRLTEALQELPEETRKIFMLYHARHLTYVEIAETLGVTTRTVERHMAKAIAHCKSRMTEYL